MIFALFASILRVLCGLGKYSGFNDPPNYGDYEAQRHWMELCSNLPPKMWYQESFSNNLSYWRLDYPPLSGYISGLFGWTSSFLDPRSMKLIQSHGYETETHKAFMRAAVLVCDIVVFYTGIFVAVPLVLQKRHIRFKLILSLMTLICSPFILIDHGHYQFNCVMHGLTIWAFATCVLGEYEIASVFFVLALNLKQMGLYYSLPFFFYILSRIIQNRAYRFAPLKTKLLWIFWNVAKVGFCVLLTFGVLWAPWLSNWSLFIGTLKAIFPFQRGLYQLKVASFWCISDVLFKWEKTFSTGLLASVSLVLTLLASTPSCLALLKKPSRKIFLLALFNVSMAFFFFSFHVHEKTILVPLVPYVLLAKTFRFSFLEFIDVSCFTMFHLLKEDQLEFQYWVYIVLVNRIIGRLVESFREIPQTNQKSLIEKINRVTTWPVYMAMVALHLAEKTVEPPEKLPYLFELLFAALGFIVFGKTVAYSHFKMANEVWKPKRKIKLINEAKKKE